MAFESFKKAYKYLRIKVGLDTPPYEGINIEGITGPIDRTNIRINSEKGLAEILEGEEKTYFLNCGIIRSDHLIPYYIGIVEGTHYRIRMKGYIQGQGHITKLENCNVPFQEKERTQPNPNF